MDDDLEADGAGFPLLVDGDDHAAARDGESRGEAVVADDAGRESGLEGVEVGGGGESEGADGGCGVEDLGEVGDALGDAGGGVAGVDGDGDVGLGVAEELYGWDVGAGKSEEKFAFAEIEAVGDATCGVSSYDAEAFGVDGFGDAAAGVVVNGVCDA